MYEENQNGLTFGSAAHAGTPEDEPDLIFALADDGVTKGYVYKSHLDQDLADSPAEAENKPDHTIQLFESDGETVIGTFTISWGEPVESEMVDMVD